MRSHTPTLLGNLHMSRLLMPLPPISSRLRPMPLALADEQVLIPSVTPDTTVTALSADQHPLAITALYTAKPVDEGAESIIFGMVDTAEKAVSAGIVPCGSESFDSLVRDWNYPFSASNTPVIEMDIRTDNWRYNVVLMYAATGGQVRWCQPDETGSKHPRSGKYTGTLGTVIAALSAVSPDGIMDDEDMLVVMGDLSAVIGIDQPAQKE